MLGEFPVLGELPCWVACFCAPLPCLVGFQPQASACTIKVISRWPHGAGLLLAACVFSRTRSNAWILFANSCSKLVGGKLGCATCQGLHAVRIWPPSMGRWHVLNKHAACIPTFGLGGDREGLWPRLCLGYGHEDQRWLALYPA